MREGKRERELREVENIIRKVLLEERRGGNLTLQRHDRHLEDTSLALV